MRSQRGNRGLMLTVVLGVIVVLGIAFVDLGTASVQTLGVSARNAQDLRAWYAADAGLEKAAVALSNSPSWNAGISTTPLVTDPTLTYQVAVTNNLSGVGAVQAPDGTVVVQGLVYVLSTGASGGVTRQSAAFARQGSVFYNAIFGDKFVSYGGSTLIDSWNSNNGPYRPSGPQAGALVGTNATGPAVVNGFGSSMADGSVTIGPGGNPSVAVDAAGHYTGSAYATQLHPMPQVVPPLGGMGPNVVSGGTLLPGVYNNVTLSSKDTLTLRSGTYYFRGNVTLHGQATITIDASGGPVIIYIDGTWDTSGGNVVNTTGKASNLQIYGTDASTAMAFAGGAQAYFVAYARRAAITLLGTSDLYGSFTGASVTLNGTARAHYDGTLGNQVLGPSYWMLFGYHRM